MANKDEAELKPVKTLKENEGPANGKALNVLSAREIEVLKLLSDGNTNKETGKRLDISVRTVETHRKNIMDKLKVKNLAGLIRFSIAHDLIKINPENP